MGREDVDGQEMREPVVPCGTEVVEDGIVRNTQVPAHEIDDRLGRSHDDEGGRGLGTETDGRPAPRLAVVACWCENSAA